LRSVASPVSARGCGRSAGTSRRRPQPAPPATFLSDPAAGKVSRTRALDRYEFSIRNGRLWLGPIYSVASVEGGGASAQIRRVGRLGAGEPATGPESLLYPADPLSST